MIAIALLLAASSPADAAAARWMQCLADQARRFAASSETADVAADAAMGACSAEEGQLDAIERRGTYGAALERMRDVQRDGRATVRQRVIARIVEIRTAR